MFSKQTLGLAPPTISPQAAENFAPQDTRVTYTCKPGTVDFNGQFTSQIGKTSSFAALADNAIGAEVTKCNLPVK
jgi:hypothetical protein